MTLDFLYSASLEKPLTDQGKYNHRRLLDEYQARKTDALSLYEPMTLQQRFHQSRTYIRLYIGGNRAGKSVATAAEFARAVRNEDPFRKYPTQGKIYVVGKSLLHCADTIYPLLFHPGSFQIIDDPVTGRWRTFRPWMPEDRKREHEAIPAPPLIPDRFIESVAWKSKQNREINRVTFTTGWEVVFFAAAGNHPQGSPVDIVWFDEEIQKSVKDGEWFPEMSARLIDRKGVMIWSAAPQKGFQELYDLYEKGRRQTAEYKADPVKYPRPEIEVFQAEQGDNVYLSAEARVRFVSNLSAEQAMIRSSGEFDVKSRLVYPEFDTALIGYPQDHPVPPHWTRYAFIDPGHAIGAVLFVACPPDDEAPFGMPMVLAYDEIYQPRCNATLLAQLMKVKSEHQQWEAFVIDMHGARPTDAGSGVSIYDSYEDAFRKAGVYSKKTGHGFTAANDDRKSGIARGHEWLAKRLVEGGSSYDAPPRFRLKTNADMTVSACPNFYYEMRRYPKKVVTNIVSDEPNDRGATHLCQCFRYCVMYTPEYLRVKMPDASRQGFRKWLDALISDQGGGVEYLSLGRSA